jgi:hypothetical protein
MVEPPRRRRARRSGAWWQPGARPAGLGGHRGRTAVRGVGRARPLPPRKLARPGPGSRFGHVKAEWPHLNQIRDPAVLRAELAVVRERYNGVRLHAGIGHVTPNDEVRRSARRCTNRNRSAPWHGTAPWAPSPPNRPPGPTRPHPARAWTWPRRCWSAWPEGCSAVLRPSSAGPPPPADAGPGRPPAPEPLSVSVSPMWPASWSRSTIYPALPRR